MCCSVLKCAAVCCSVIQGVAVCCSVLNLNRSLHKRHCTKKEPCTSAKVAYIPAKEPYISGKEPYISTKVPFIAAKQPCILAKEPYISVQQRRFFKVILRLNLSLHNRLCTKSTMDKPLDLIGYTAWDLPVYWIYKTKETYILGKEPYISGHNPGFNVGTLRRIGLCTESTKQKRPTFWEKSPTFQDTSLDSMWVHCVELASVLNLRNKTPEI